MTWQVRGTIAAFLVTLAIAYETVTAQERVGSNYTIYGLGAENCSTLVEYLSDGNRSVRESWRSNLGTWIGGYVTGFDAHAGLSRMLITGAMEKRDPAAFPSSVTRLWGCAPKPPKFQSDIKIFIRY